MSEEPNKKENQSDSPSDDDGTLFSYEEMRDFVKGFYIAYTNDKIKLNFLKGAQNKFSEQFGITMYSGKDVDMDYNNKVQLQEAIDIAIGKTIASKEERKAKIIGIFGVIFAYKMNGWLEGSFYDFSLEKRLAEIERKYANHDEIIHGYINHLREEFGV